MEDADITTQSRIVELEYEVRQLHEAVRSLRSLLRPGYGGEFETAAQEDAYRCVVSAFPMVPELREELGGTCPAAANGD